MLLQLWQSSQPDVIKSRFEQLRLIQTFFIAELIGGIAREYVIPSFWLIFTFIVFFFALWRRNRELQLASYTFQSIEVEQEFTAMESRSQSNKTIIFVKLIFFSFHIYAQPFWNKYIIFLCYKHSSLTAKIGKHRKTKDFKDWYLGLI